MKPVTEPILCAAASAFDFGGPMVCDPHHYGEGHINDTFVVWRANHTKRFILQRINTDTFTDPAGKHLWRDPAFTDKDSGRGRRS